MENVLSITVTIVLAVLVAYFIMFFKRRPKWDDKSFLIPAGNVHIEYKKDDVNFDEVRRDVERSIDRIAIRGEHSNGNKIETLDKLDLITDSKCRYGLSVGVITDLLMKIYPGDLPSLNSPNWKVVVAEDKSIRLHIEGFVGKPILSKDKVLTKVGPYLLKCSSNDLRVSEDALEFRYSVIKSKYY